MESACEAVGKGKNARSRPIGWLLALFMAVAALSAGALLWRLHGYETRLKEADGHYGIVSLQLAGTAARANAIVRAWSAFPKESAVSSASPVSRIAYARASVYDDFAFIPAWALTFVLAMLCIFRPLGFRCRPLRWLFALPVAAALLDVGENFALLRILDAGGSAGQAAVTLATLAAGVKFFLLAVTLLAVLSALCFWLLTCPWREERECVGGDREVPRRVGQEGRKRRRAWPFIKPIERVVRNEQRYLRSRRRLAGLESPEELGRRAVGLSLSGGGIRSAMQGLGVLQTLMQNGLIRHVDYLSTVSGGGYVGTALSSLLSARRIDEGPAPGGSEQFVFRPGDTPHFDLDPDGVRAPFAEAVASGSAGRQPCSWIDGKMVVTHLRAFGDYLVRRRRLLDRDMLRAVGGIGAGIVATLLLFASLMLLISGVVLILIHLNQADAFASVPEEFGDYLSGMWKGMQISHFTLVAILGGLLLAATAIFASLIQIQSPILWFKRDGDTADEAGQYRLLWIVGGIALACGLLLCGPLARELPGARPSLLFPVAFFLGGAVAAGFAYVAMVVARGETGLFGSNIQRRSFVAASLALCCYLLILCAGLALLPWGLGAIGKALRLPATVSLSGGAAMGAFAWWNAHRVQVKEFKGQVERGVKWLKRASETLRRLVLGLVVAVFVIASLILGLSFVHGMLAPPSPPKELYGLALVAVTVLLGLAFYLLGVVLDFNKLSLHYFYRDRLVDAFLRTEARPAKAYGRNLELKRDHQEMQVTELHGVGKDCLPRLPARESFIQYEAVGKPRRREFSFQDAEPLKPRAWRFAGAATAAPYHLYVACVNLGTERDMHFRSRKSDIFIFSKLYCGSSVTGYVDSGVYRSGDTKVARVMTTSGAAVDSALGRDTFFAQSFATTLFNIRLGQWMENPAFRAGSHVHLQENGVFWPLYMVMESLGMSDSTRRLVHLSDGGHSGDNLGLIPLLQRRCRLIIAMDAEKDPDYRFESLVHAICYAEVDLGIRIDLRLNTLNPAETGLAAAHFAIGHIHYPKTIACPEEDGVLVVLKSSVTSSDSVLIQKFKQAHPEFPQESTADQFFSEDQVEAYRQLGRAMAESLLSAHPELARGDLSISASRGAS